MIKSNLDISELPLELLLKSPTYRKYTELCARCTICGEMTGALHPCCSANLDFEGGFLNPELLWDCIADEIATQLPKPPKVL